ncbi:hypothetical protein [Dolosigranulum savutiense]|uniref:Uncharacterized protein n=1 Tax=Dolosigranulum savutiense TaxID=3110288 RepID=A0AB74TNW6_9LACT
MAGKWTEYSDEQLLEMLKKTIEDMGMTKYPSRTELQKHIGDYDIPSPTSYLYRFDCSWQELMERIDYGYDLEELYSEVNRENAEERMTENTGKKKENVRWRDESRKEIVEAIIENMRKDHIITFTEYKERRDRETTPSAATLSRKNIKWSEIKNEYKARYG